jgi:hypothetical protein
MAWKPVSIKLPIFGLIDKFALFARFVWQTYVLNLFSMGKKSCLIPDLHFSQIPTYFLLCKMWRKYYKMQHINEKISTLFTQWIIILLSFRIYEIYNKGKNWFHSKNFEIFFSSKHVFYWLKSLKENFPSVKRRHWRGRKFVLRQQPKTKRSRELKFWLLASFGPNFTIEQTWLLFFVAILYSEKMVYSEFSNFES